MIPQAPIASHDRYQVLLPLGGCAGLKSTSPSRYQRNGTIKGRTTFDEASEAVIDLCHSEHQALINKRATDKIIWLMAKLESQYK